MSKSKKPAAPPEPKQTACRCGSTERTEYTVRNIVAYDGIHAGLPYTHTVWLNTACLKCGQRRVDVFRENRS